MYRIVYIITTNSFYSLLNINMKTPEQVQKERRAILILVKNGFQKLIEGWRLDLKPVYDDLQNFLYGTDPFTRWPYMVSVEELEYYQELYRGIMEQMRK